MNAKPLTFMLALFLTNLAFGQIQGEVVDDEMKPLSGVLVWIENASYEVRTDTEGQYSIDYFPGEFTVHYGKSGYFNQEMKLNLAVKDVFPAKRIVMLRMPPPDTMAALGPPGNRYIELPASNLLPPPEGKVRPARGSLNAFNPFFGNDARYTFDGEYLVLPNDSDTLFVFRSAAIRNAKNARPESDYVLYKFQTAKDGSQYLVVMAAPQDEKFSTSKGCNDGLYREPSPALSPGLYAFVMSDQSMEDFGKRRLNFRRLKEPVYAFEISDNTSEWYKVKTTRLGSRAVDRADESAEYEINDMPLEPWPSGSYVYTQNTRTDKDIYRQENMVTIKGTSFTYDMDYNSELLPNASRWSEPGLRNTRVRGNLIRYTGEIINIRPDSIEVKLMKKERISCYPKEWLKLGVQQKRFFGTWIFVRTSNGMADKRELTTVFKQVR